ncbi:hypothetical protein DFQ26_003899 [Actinomortierella ambigua]|nr:hypothetical protein DFQ26_003899 [Actinomortierella ambigua]
MANWSTVPPEVLLQMGKRLNRRSLVACLLVNRLWYQLFLPQVWQVALARDWADARFCAYLEDHIHLVQHLEWCDMDWLDHRAGKIQQSPFSSFCAAARFHFRDWNQYRNRFCSIVDQDSMADLLGRLKRGDDPGAAGEAPTNACRLRKLSIALHGPMGIQLATAISSLGPLQRIVLISDSWHETLDSPQDWLQMSQAWLTICLNVEELFVWNLSRRAHAPITTLEPRPPLHFDISSSWSTMLDEGELVRERQKHDKLYYYDHDYLLPLGWEDARFPTLKKLFLANMSMSPETFLRWLERCPNLSSVQWPCFLRPSASTEVKTSPFKAAHHFLASPGFRERLPAHFQDRLKHLWVDRLNLVEIAVSSTFGCTHNLRQVNLRSR